MKSMKKSDKECCNTGSCSTMGSCCKSMCPKCKGMGKVVLGLLVAANTAWPQVSWPYFIAIVLVIMGLKKAFMPSCGHCQK